MFFQHKKIIAIIILTIVAAACSLPVFVFAQTAADEPPTQCWPQNLCGQKSGNWAQTTESKTLCGKYESKSGALGFCYAKQPDVNLKIAFGEKSVVKGLADYIGSIYNYLISIVSIIAIVMIMVGGLRYLTAGGNPSAITSAKETILGAVIGLFLTLGSYTLLQTINPALVSLKLPDIKMIRTSTLQQTAGGECPADSPQRTGAKGVTFADCKNICDCTKGEECIPMEGSARQIISASKFVVWSATAVAGGAVVGGANVASGAKYIIEGAYDKLGPLAVKLGVKILKNPIKSTLGYLAVSSLSGSSNPAIKSVDNGVCVSLAKQTVSGGGLCAFTSNCIAPLKCIDPVSKKELTVKQLGDIGSCVGDARAFGNTMPCTEDSTCAANAGSNADLRCIGGFCSWGAENHNCCINGEINNVLQLCDKGFNKCESGLSCGFYYSGKLYKTNGEYFTGAGFISSADPGLLTTLKETLKNSGGKCMEDTPPDNWAPSSLYGSP